MVLNFVGSFRFLIVLVHILFEYFNSKFGFDCGILINELFIVLVYSYPDIITWVTGGQMNLEHVWTICIYSDDTCIYRVLKRTDIQCRISIQKHPSAEEPNKSKKST